MTADLIARLRMGTQVPEFDLRQEAADEIERLRRLTEMSDEETNVMRAAVRWWEMKRPCAFAVADHLYEPAVNCVGQQERDLAKTVAVLLTKTPKP